MVSNVLCGNLTSICSKIAFNSTFGLTWRPRHLSNSLTCRY